MSTPRDLMLQQLLESRQSVSDRKQQNIEQSSARKRQTLDPAYEVFDPDIWDVSDADTFEHRFTGEKIRVQGTPGRAIDSFETSDQYYLNNPDKLKRDKYTFARLYGRDPDDVSVGDLTDLGKVQALRLQDAKENLRGVGFRRDGVDVHGRSLAQFEDESAFQQAFDSTGGAEYFSGRNYAQTQQDIASGEFGKMSGSTDRNNLRALTGDAAVNLAAGVGQFANTVGQAATLALPGETSEGVDEFFSNNRERLKRFKEIFGSDEMIFREEMDQKAAGFTADLYRVNKQKYLDEGMSETNAAIFAGGEEFVDRIAYLLDEPGRVLDATIESLPYMFGAGLTGRIAGKATEKYIGKKIIERVGKESAANATKRFLASKAGRTYMKTAQTASTVGFVGLSEGMSISADAYDAVVNMSEQEASQSEAYRNLRSQGQSHQEAVKTLAEDVYYDTLGKGIAMAAGASLLTGAGAWEAGLFKSMKRIRKEAKKPSAPAQTAPGKAPKGGIVRQALSKGVQKGFNLTGKYAKFAGGPGLREASEELIQSGGGEFLTQLAKFEQGLTQEVGPGIGKAAGEGAAIGFASGAGIQSTVGGTKVGARKLLDLGDRARTSKVGKRIQKQPVGPSGGEVSNLKDNAGNIGGSATATVTAQTRQEVFSDDAQDITNFENFLAVRADMRDNPDSYTDRQKGAFPTAERTFLRQVDKAASKVLGRGKEPEQLSDEERQILQVAFDEDVAAVKDLDPESTLGQILNHNKEARSAVDNARKLAETDAQVRAQSGESKKVSKEKLGDTEGSKGPGLGWYNRVLSQAIANSDQATFARVGEKFSNFLNSQARKIQRLGEAIEAGQAGEQGKYEFEYKQGSSEAFYNSLKQEYDLMEQVHTSLLAQQEAWGGKGAEKAAAKVTKNLTPPASRPSADTADSPRVAQIRQRLQGTKFPTVVKLARNNGINPNGKRPGEVIEELVQVLANKEGTNEPRQRKTRNINDQTQGQTQSDTDGTGTNTESGSTAETGTEREETKSGKGKQKAEGSGRVKKTKRATNPKRQAEQQETLAKSLGSERLATLSDNALGILENRVKQLFPEGEQAPHLKKIADERARRTGEEAEPVQETEVSNNTEQSEELNKIHHTKQKIYSITTSRGPKVGAKAVAEFHIYGYKFIIHRPLSYTGKPESKSGWHVTILETGQLIGADTQSSIQAAYDVAMRTIKDMGEEKVNALVAKATGKPAPAPKAKKETKTTPVDETVEETVEPDVAKAAIENAMFDQKDWKRTLDLISKFSTNVAYRVLASQLQKSLQGRKITIGVFSDKVFNEKVGSISSKPPTAAWLADDQTVALKESQRGNASNEEAFLHELMHAGLNNFMTRPKKTKAEKELHNRAQELRKAIISWLKDTINALDENLDGTTYERVLSRLEENKEEFLTYGMSNDMTQAVMSEIKIGNESAFDKFVKLVADILGLDVGQTALEEVIKLGSDILAINQGQPAKAPSRGERYVPTPEAEALAKAQAAEAAAEAQAEAQPERSADAKAEGIFTSEEIARNDGNLEALEEASTQLSELRNGKLNEDEVYLLRDRARARYEELLQDMDAEAALAQLVAEIEDRLLTDENGNRIQKSVTPDSQVENLEEAINQAKQLLETGRAETATKNTTPDATAFTSVSRWDSIKSWIGGTNSKSAPSVSKFRAAIERKLGEIGMPASVGKGFEKRSRFATSLLTAIPNLHEILADPASRNQFYNDLELKPNEKRAFEQFRLFRDEFKAALSESMNDLSQSKYVGERLKDNPVYLFTDEDNNLDPNLVSAMALEAMQWLASDGTNTLFNDDDAIIDILGLPDGTVLDDNQKMLRSVGTLQRNLVLQLGRSAFSHLNLEAKTAPELDYNLQERMEMSIGNVMIRALIVSSPNNEVIGRVEPWAVSGPLFKSMRGPENTLEVSDDVDVNFIRISGERMEGRQTFTPLQENVELRDNYRGGRTVFQKLFDPRYNVKEPLMAPPPEKMVPRRARRSLSKLSQKMRSALDNLNKQAYHTDNGVINTLSRFNEIEYLEMAHDYDPNPVGIHVTERESVEGRNRTLLSALQNAKTWFAETEDQNFWFSHFVTRTGRTNMESTFINPQNNKLHRFTFRQDAWITELNPSEDPETFTNWKLAVALGMGIDADKLPQEEALAQLEELMEKEEVTRPLEILRQGGDIVGAEAEAFRSVLGREGTHTLAAMLAWNDYLAADGGTFVSSLPMEVDGVTNGFAAGLLQTPPIDPKDWADLKRLLNATGVLYVDQGDFANLSEWLRDEINNDNYQEAAKRVARQLEKSQFRGTRDMPEDREGQYFWTFDNMIANITGSGFAPTEDQLLDRKEGRKFAKNPLMIVSYGASLNTVARNVANGMMENFHTQLAATNRTAQEENLSPEEHAELVLEVINRALDVMRVSQLAANRGQGKSENRFMRQYEPWTIDTLRNYVARDNRSRNPQYNGSLAQFAENFQWTGWQKYHFENAFRQTYGAGIRSALGNMMGGIMPQRTTLNGAITAMSAIYQQDLQRRIAAEEKGKSKLGQSRIREIMREMHAEGLVPSVATLYSSRLDENLDISRYELEGMDDRVQVRYPKNGLVVRGRINENGEREFLDDTVSQTTSLTRRMPTADVGVAGIVGTIHSMDGTNIADVYAKHNIMSIFDAALMGPKDVREVTQMLNRRFYGQGKEYDMAAELSKSFRRMMSLMRASDQRLTAAQRTAAAEVFAEQAQKHNIMDEDTIDSYLKEEDYEGLLNHFAEFDLASAVRSIAATRQKLFEKIGSMSQFSLDKYQYNVPGKERSSPISTTVDAVEYTEQQRVLREVDKVSDELINNLNEEDGDFVGTFFSWLQSGITNVTPVQALQVIGATLDKLESPAAEAVTELVGLLSQYVPESTIRVGPLPKNKFSAINIETGNITIDKDKFLDGTHNPIESLLHEIVHSATQQAVNALQEQESPAFIQLVERAASMLGRLNSNKNRTPQEDVLRAVLQENLKDKDPIRQRMAVGEYLAWGLTHGTGQRDFELAFNQNVRLEVINSAIRVLTADNTQNLRLRAGPNQVREELFVGANERLLESTKLWDNLQKMRELDQGTEAAPNQNYQNHIQRLFERVLVPGVGAMNDLFLQTAIDPDGIRNTGDVTVNDDRNIIRVQTSGNRLTNTNEMSNQEIYSHEIVHAVLGPAINNDTKIRAELRKIYEFVADRVTWEAFMPQNVSGDRAAAESAAQDRYDYIFGVNPTTDQLQEFAAVALTNEQFGKVLATLDGPVAADPIWDGHILSSLINLLIRAAEFVRSASLRTRKAGNPYEATMALAESIVRINNRAELFNAEKDPSKLWRNKFDRQLTALGHKGLDAWQEKLRSEEEKRRNNGTWRNAIRAGVHAGLASRNDAQQQIYNRFALQRGLDRSSALAEAISEALPWDSNNANGPTGQMGFIDLLRLSKVHIDIARQRQIEHSRRVLLDSFDKKRRLTRPQRMAMTAAIMKTDLTSLMEHNKSLSHRDLQRMLGDDQVVGQELGLLQSQLDTLLAQDGATNAATMFRRQMHSLANWMVNGEMTEYMGMKNAHNIVKQFNLPNAKDRVPITNEAEITAVVDQITTLLALQLTSRETKDLALQVVNNEMARSNDNGFYALLGMHSDFKRVAQHDLFDGNPVQMSKGYVYEMMDGDIDMKIVEDTADNIENMESQGYVLIGKLPTDKYDISTKGRDGKDRLIFKGYRGANTWQKAIVSLTDTHRRGTNLFEAVGYDPGRARDAFGHMRTRHATEALKQFRPGSEAGNTIAIPVLDDTGKVVDYTYQMSDAAKQTHLKKRDYFDQVLPRMFGSIPDRTKSGWINQQVADLLREEWEAYQDSPDHAFNEISATSDDPRAKEMYMLLPDGFKEALNEAFRGTGFVNSFPIRPEAINLVMGFRKLSVLDIQRPGGGNLIQGPNMTYIARTAEKVWQEVMQLVRIKMAIINPLVVFGNLLSNFGILTMEGIPFSYQKKMAAEAMRSMRLYQRDVRKVDELQRIIGIKQAAGENVDKLVVQRERLRREFLNNPVGKLVREGLFTSIVEDVSADEDSYREWVIGSGLDKIASALPGKAVNLAKEAYMVPGSKAFNIAIAATQYGDFIGRYVKFKYDTEVRDMPEREAIQRALASFIYYDMPQNRWLQAANDNGFLMFTKFFLRIQSIVARLFAENPTKASAVFATQMLFSSPYSENIGSYALFNRAGNRFEPIPLMHLDTLDPLSPSLFRWLLGPFGF